MRSMTGLEEGRPEIPRYVAKEQYVVSMYLCWAVYMLVEEVAEREVWVAVVLPGPDQESLLYVVNEDPYVRDVDRALF